MLYIAPIWSDEFAHSRMVQVSLRKAQRLIAQRVVCAYRTISLDAATLLAGFPPLPFGDSEEKDVLKNPWLFRLLSSQNSENRE